MEHRRGLHIAIAFAAVLLLAVFSAWSYEPPEDAEAAQATLDARVDARYAIETGDTEDIETAEHGAHRSEEALAHVVIALAEVHGPSRARPWIARLPDDEHATLGSTPLIRWLYFDDAGLTRRAAELSAGNRATLEDELGWIGRVAAAPRGTDETVRRALLRENTLWFMVTGAVGGIWSLIELAGIVAAIWLFARRKPFRSRFVADAEPSPVTVEAVAVNFMVVVISWRHGADLWSLIPEYSYRETVICAAIGIGVPLAWMRLRRMSWAEIRTRTGLHPGDGFWREAGVGAVSIALLSGLAIVARFIEDSVGLDGGAPHPSTLGVEELTRGQFSWLLFQGAVLAPVEEELLFRGCLYGALRALTNSLPRWKSVTISAVSQGFVFAIIHPQGIGAVVGLTAFGAALALLREWRGSLVAPIVAHGIWNATIYLGIGTLAR